MCAWLMLERACQEEVPRGLVSGDERSPPTDIRQVRHLSWRRFHTYMEILHIRKKEKKVALYMRFGILSTQKHIFRSPKPEIFGENFEKTLLNYQRVNRKPMFFFFFGISLLFDVILCERYNGAVFNLSCTICHMPLSLKKRYTSKNCAAESLLSNGLTLNSRSFEPRAFPPVCNSRLFFT